MRSDGHPLAAALLVTSNLIQAEENVFEAVPLGVEAYIYCYPLVTMEMTRRVFTNVEKPEGIHAPMGQLLRARAYPPASYRGVTAPNADTLYTTAWINVGNEPWVLSRRTSTIVTIFSRCSTAGRTCSRSPVNAPPAPARRNTPSPAPAGMAPSPRT